MKRIPLHAHDGTTRDWALVDDDDYAALSAFPWHVATRGYAVRHARPNGPGTPRRIELMHRAIMGLTYGDGLQVDHINRDKLDNRRANLRIVDQRANNQNTPGGHGLSGLRGVQWRADRNRWIVRVVVDGRQHLGGSFTDPAEAALAAAELRLRLMPYATG